MSLFQRFMLSAPLCMSVTPKTLSRYCLWFHLSSSAWRFGSKCMRNYLLKHVLSTICSFLRVTGALWLLWSSRAYSLEYSGTWLRPSPDLAACCNGTSNAKCELMTEAAFAASCLLPRGQHLFFFVCFSMEVFPECNYDVLGD